jgi:hypothetical protein
VREITESGAAIWWAGRRQIAGSACVIRLADACSVRPRTDDLGALDLSARSGVDQGNVIADRQICASSGRADMAVAMVVVFNAAWPKAAQPTLPGVVLVGGAPREQQRGFG